MTPSNSRAAATADRLEARPPGAFDEKVDRNHREPADERHRVSQPDRSMFGALAEFERSLIRERTQAGLAATRRAGRRGGRPPKLTDDDIGPAKAMLANPDIGVTQIAHRLGVSPATLYRHIPARTAKYPRRLTGAREPPAGWAMKE